MNKGYFGSFGGLFIPETLSYALRELDELYSSTKNDVSFRTELEELYKNYVGRPSPLYFAEKYTTDIGGPKIWFKREDLNHTGAHKINNTVGQALLAKRLGKKRIIAETGAGQHGVATATICAKLDLDCTIYMGKPISFDKSLMFSKLKLLGQK